MVTGATGYVAGWLVKLLLDNGFTVHAPIRNPNDKNKTQYLDKLAASAPGTLRYFEADLLREGSYDKAMQGCELVFHTASPFALKVKDAQRDLIDPAIEGTRNILNAVNKTASVKRVVLTSSVAAMYGDNKDLQQLPHHSITEEVWNTTSSVDHQPYSYSKTMAEKEAWKMQNQQQRWDLVVINPSLVMGPGISPEITSESFKIIKQLGDGTMKMGAPDYEIGLVDVRDVAPPASLPPPKDVTLSPATTPAYWRFQRCCAMLLAMLILFPPEKFRSFFYGSSDLWQDFHAR